MVANRKPGGRALSIPAGLARSGITSLVLTLMGAGLLAKLMDLGKLRPENLGYGIMVLLTMASMAGAATAWRRIRRRKIMVCLLSGIIYYAELLLITALFFGGQYQGAGETGLMVLCGCMLPILTPKMGKSRAAQRKFRIRNG